jgi:hypothetical protein
MNEVAASLKIETPQSVCFFQIDQSLPQIKLHL